LIGKFEVMNDMANAMDSENKDLAKLRKELRVSGAADMVNAGRPSGQLEDEA